MKEKIDEMTWEELCEKAKAMGYEERESSVFENGEKVASKSIEKYKMHFHNNGMVLGINIKHEQMYQIMKALK